MDNKIMNTAEQVVYTYVENYFKGRQATLLSQYPIFDIKNNVRYEPDIIAIDRKLGCINIEVKGLLIDNISHIEGHLWHCNDFYADKLLPYKQAEKQSDILICKLKQHQVIKNDISKRIFIALPFIESNEWRDKGFNLICTPTLLFKDDFISGRWVDKLQKGILHHAKPNITAGDFMAVKSYFNTEKEELTMVKDEGYPYSKLWIINETSNILAKRSSILDDIKKGVKTFVITTDVIMSKLLLPDNEALEKNGIINYHLHNTNEWDEITIINGEGITNELSKQLESVESFNYRQYKAIHHPYDGNVVIGASAGTGKTYLLVDRIIYLLTSSPATLEDINIITFTNAAADEMRDRISNRLRGLFELTYNLKLLYLLENFNNLRISTIHSFAKSVIIEHADDLGLNKSVKVSSFKYEKRRIIQSLINDFVEEMQDTDINHLLGLPQYRIVDFIIDIVEKIENKAISYEEVKSIKWGCADTILGELIKYVVPRVDQELCALKIKYDKLGINDLVRMLNNIKNVKALDNRMRFLFIDEFQDSDVGQIKFISTLMNSAGYRLFIIGDVKQSIYRFRGADHTAYEQLEILSQQSLTDFSLVNNYRSSKKLVNMQNKLFAALAKRNLLNYDIKDMIRGQKKFNTNIQQLIKVDSKECAKKETIKLVRHIAEISPEDSVAILVRSNSDILTVRDWFADTNLMVNEEVDGDFFTTNVVMDFRCLLVGLMFHNDSRSLYDAYSSPYFGFIFDPLNLKEFDGDNDNICNYLRFKTGNALEKYVNYLSKEPLLTVINRIIADNSFYDNLYTGLKKSYPNEDDDTLRERVIIYAKNLHHLFKLIIKTFNTESNSLPQIYEWLDMKIRSDRKEDSINVAETKSNINIMTVHKSKGLEFDYVILPIMNKSFTFRKTDVILDPISMTLSWKLDDKVKSKNYKNMFEKEIREVEKEEARLLYVAITRAVKSLTLIMPYKAKNNTWAKLLEDDLEEIGYGC